MGSGIILLISPQTDELFNSKSLALLMPINAIAGTAIQTDWSGGDGFPGPVTNWNDLFYTDTDIECYLNPSNLIIERTFRQPPLEHIVDALFDTAFDVYSADVDGDGDMDILGAAYLDSDITWWENDDGSGTSWTEHTVDDSFSGAMSVYAANIDGDTNMDVLGAAMHDDDITWWKNTNGLGTSWTEYTIDGDFDGARSVYSADINGDGDMDVLGAAISADDITWWENDDGSGTSWTERTVDVDFDGAVSVFSSDIDGDGDMDILGAASESDDITWWENVDGIGGSWMKHTIEGDFDAAKSVCSADINGDAWMDVLGAAAIANDITWWDLTEYLPEGSLLSSILYIDESPDWQSIDWTCTEPSGTAVAFQVRASISAANMGTWSAILSNPCNLDGILSDGDNYFQYRVILNSTNSFLTSVLHEVTVIWNPVGIEGGSGVELYSLYGACPNPALGHATLVFSLPVDSWAELTVYDLTGRMVYSVSDDYEPGVHEVLLNDLACGMYLIRMKSEEFTATRQFVVIE
jgi:hypothetical protein